MRDALTLLSEREKDTLRRLLVGHDAKSIARDLDLSVHTVNERLRDARRKLGVSSSREAARLLAEQEGNAPNIIGDKQIGVAVASPGATALEQVKRSQLGGLPLAWLGGGMLIMSLIIAAVALSSVFHGSGGSPSAGVSASPIAVTSSDTTEAASARVARDWITLVDNRRLADSWSTAGTLFRSQVTQENWVKMVQGVRETLGPVSSRTFKTVTKTASPPGAPAGDYEIIQFETNFANKQKAAENVVLAHENAGWKVVGYFIQ